ncbi:MAG: MFS transporter [Polyangiaceae bacterium]
MTDDANEPPLSPALVALFACGAGLSVSGLYLNQPILAAMAKELGATPAAIGFVPTLTQLGYATGILLFAPLGDRLDRRRVIVWKAALLALALLGAAAARSVPALGAASLGIGLFATLAQDFVPAAATLAPARVRGRVVGTVMTGLLLGILLSRLVSGALGERFGFRAVFVAAAAAIVALGLVSLAKLPSIAPTTREPYWTLLASIVRLARDVAPLRHAAVAQALLSVAFSGFWSTLALAVASPPFSLGSTAAGAFGLAGAAGALIAPIAGATADRRGPEAVIVLGALVVLASFVVMGVWPGSLAILIAGTVTFDLGVQACLISHQTIVYGLDPSARSRLNAVLVSTMFFGMSSGAALASRALAHFGWSGVCALGALATLGALVVRALPGARAVRAP